MNRRQIARIIAAIATSDGAGVKLKRSLGQSPGARLDPLLMLDEFYSDRPEDYLGGFPSHPHRGFETVTYMLAGNMLHRDHMDNRGELGPGDLQWMTAGRGVIHSEMPQQRDGLLRGFQLWINLPAKEKWRAAEYRDIAAEQIPELRRPGLRLRHLAGRLQLPSEQSQSTGYINGTDGRQLSTDPLYADLQLAAGRELTLQFDAGHNACVYVYNGQLSIGGRAVQAGEAALLDRGDYLQLSSETGADALLLAGRPIGEAIVQYGPFVMNSADEIEQALRDYRNGQLTDSGKPAVNDSH